MSLSVRVGLVEFTANLQVNRANKWPEINYLTGPSGRFHNSLLAALKINATFVLENQIGDCYSNATCNGLVGLLDTGQADFSLLPLPHDFDEGYPVSFRRPFIPGPFGLESYIAFESMPIVNRSVRKVDVLHFYKSTDSLVYVILLLSIWTIYAVNKLRLHKRRKSVSIKIFQTKTLFFFFESFFSNRSNNLSKFAHLNILFITFFALITLVTHLINASINSEAIRVNPAKYYQNLEQLVSAAEKNQAVIYSHSGLYIQSKLVRRSNTIYGRLAKIAKFISKDSMFEMPQKLINSTYVLIASGELLSATNVLLCDERTKSISLNLKESKPFHKVQGVLAMSSNISLHSKKRIERIYTYAFEWHLMNLYQSKISECIAESMNTISRDEVIRCQWQKSLAPKEIDSLENSFSVILFDSEVILFKVYFFSCLIATFAFVFECICCQL